MQEGGAKQKTKGAIEAVGEKAHDFLDGDRESERVPRRKRREED
jgi:hypothetical protein